MCGTQGAATDWGPGDLLRAVWSGDVEQAAAAWHELGRRAARDGWARRFVFDVAAGKLSLPAERAIPALRKLARRAPEHVWGLAREREGAAASVAGAALGQVGSRFRRELVSLTTEREVSPQLAGIAGLAELAAQASLEAAEALGVCLHSSHGQVRSAAATALGRARGRRCVKRTFAILEAVVGKGDEHVLSGAASAAASLWAASRRTAVRLLVSILRQTPAGARAVALAVQGLPCRAGVQVLRNCPLGSESDTCPFCAPALAKWAQEGSEFARRKLQALARSIRPGARAAAGELIAAEEELGDLATVEHLAADPSPLVRSAVAEGLARRRDQRTREVLLRLARDRAVSVRAQAVTALGALGEQQVTRRAMTDRAPAVRAAAAQALDPQQPGSMDLLIGLSYEPDPEVAEAAARALGRAGGGLSGPAWTRLLELAGEASMQRAAAEAMAAVFDSDPKATIAVGNWYPVKQGAATVLRLIARAAHDPVAAEVARTRLRVMEAGDDLVEALEDAAVLLATFGREDDLETLTWVVRCLRATTLEEIAAAAADTSVARVVPARPFVAAGRAVERALRARAEETRARHLGQALAALEVVLQQEPLVLAAMVLRRAALAWQAVIERAMPASAEAARIEVTLAATRLAGQPQATAVVEIVNTGQAVARDVVVSGEGVEHVVGALPPGASREVLMEFAPVGAERQRIEGQVRLHDGVQVSSVHYHGVSEAVAPGALAPVDNPYVVGKPLPGESAMFFGRAAEVAFVERALAGGESGSVVVLAGQRRTGKTSLLKHLAARLSDSYRAVFVDLQGLLVFDTEDLFLSLAHQIVPRDHDGWFAGVGIAPGTTGVEWVQEAAARYGRRVVLLVDELDHLDEELRAGHVDTEVFAHLRHLIQHGENIAFVLCGSLRMTELAGEPWSFLLNLATHRQIGPLTEEEAADLVRVPLGKLGIVCEDAAMALALRLAGRQPYFLQLLGYHLVERCVELRDGGVSTRLVGQVADEVAALGEIHLRHLWDMAGGPGQAVLQALATTEEWVTAQELARRAGISQAQADIALQELVRRDTVEEARPGGQASGWYRLRLGLLGRWLAGYGRAGAPATRARG